jgi:hypothetical protein
MFGKTVILGAVAMGMLTIAPTAATAQGWGDGYRAVTPVQYYDGGRGAWRGRDGYDDRGYGYGRRWRGYDGPRGYYDGRRYGGYAPRYVGRGYASGYDGYGRGYRRYRCDRGTGGTIIGAIAGGLLGNAIGQGNGGYYGRGGDGTTGAIIGGGLGALAGRAIDRNC